MSIVEAIGGSLLVRIRSEPTSKVSFYVWVQLKACALIGLHFLVVSTSQFPDLGDMWRHCCPIIPEWISSCSTSETSCGGEEYEHNNECRAIEVIGQDWSSEVVAHLFEDWELGRVALSCRMAMGLLCQEMRDACWVSSESLGSPRSMCSQCRRSSLAELSQKQSLSPWTGCDNEGEGCGGRYEGRRNLSGESF